MKCIRLNMFHDPHGFIWPDEDTTTYIMNWYGHEEQTKPLMIVPISIPSCNIISMVRSEFINKEEGCAFDDPVEITVITLGCLASSACKVIYVVDTLEAVEKLLEAAGS